MKIDLIHIKNFRSIKECKIHFKDVLAVVGQNNSGKSSVLRAINCFFNTDAERENFVNGSHRFSRGYPVIEVCFSDFSSDEHSDLLDFIDNNKLVLRQTFNSSKNKKYFSYSFLKGGAYTKCTPEDAKKVKSYFHYVYIDPLNHQKDLRWGTKSLSSELVVRFLQHETKNRDTLTPKFSDAAKYLEKNFLHKIGSQINSGFPIRHNLKFKIEFQNRSNFKYFLNDLEIFIEENEDKHLIKEFGLGIRWLAFITMHQILAEMRGINIIYGIEEPESNLHPQAQKELIKTLQKNAKEKHNVQFIFSSHSTVLIDSLTHEDIVLVKKKSSSERSVISEVSSITTDFFTKHNLTKPKYYNFFSYRNSDFFFANHLIFVESKIDAEVVRLIAQKNNIDIDFYGISIVNLDGVNNLPYPLYLASELGLPYLLIVDKDFFIPYRNDELELSRSGNGTPLYRYEYDGKREKLIEFLINDRQQRTLLLNLFKTNHSEALNKLSEYEIISMNYNLETDLLCSTQALDLMIQKANISGINSSKTSEKLKKCLVDNKKSIKKSENILHVLSNISRRNYPNSYKRILKKIQQIKSRIESN